jgi:hypothetical protein
VSHLSQALEVEVGALHAVQRRAEGREMTQRERAQIDRHMARLLRLMAPRIRHFTRAYGLVDAAEDARQACAIGVLRAVDMYDPAKASFTTLVNWQLRGELQSLRYRLRPDRRMPAKALGARTLSLQDAQAEGLSQAWLEDAEALARAEALAAQVLARRACGQLLDEHLTEARLAALHQIERRSTTRGPECVKPGTVDPDHLDRLDRKLAHERQITFAYLLGQEDDRHEQDLGDGDMSAEQRRQIARRTIRSLSRIARGNPRYDPDADSVASPTRH